MADIHDQHGNRALPWKGAIVMLALVAAFYLLREHWNHVAGYGAYILLLACPLMHLFGHGHGHGHGGGHQHGDSSSPPGGGKREGSF